MKGADEIDDATAELHHGWGHDLRCSAIASTMAASQPTNEAVNAQTFVPPAGPPGRTEVPEPMGSLDIDELMAEGHCRTS